jgi:hypothetical protein
MLWRCMLSALNETAACGRWMSSWPLLTSVCPHQYGVLSGPVDFLGGRVSVSYRTCCQYLNACYKWWPKTCRRYWETEQEIMQATADAYVTADSFILFSLASCTALYRSMTSSSFVLCVFIYFYSPLSRSPHAVGQITSLSPPVRKQNGNSKIYVSTLQCRIYMTIAEFQRRVTNSPFVWNPKVNLHMHKNQPWTLSWAKAARSMASYRTSSEFILISFSCCMLSYCSKRVICLLSYCCTTATGWKPICS